MQVLSPHDFSEWRATARVLWRQQVPPHAVRWLEKNRTRSLFDAAFIESDELGAAHAVEHPQRTAPALRMSRFALDQLETASMYRSADRWAFLYCVLWRLGHDDNEVLSPADADGMRLSRMVKAVRRDIHHMHAFVRFREYGEATNSGRPFDDIDIATGDLNPAAKEGETANAPQRPGDLNTPRFVAWYEPQHDILIPVGSHFASRMGKLSWLIATPIGTVASDGKRLELGPPTSKPDLDEDAVESLWLTYYRSTFNPARVNLPAMQSHMPEYYWKNLPEAQLIPELVSGARITGPVTPRVQHQRRDTATPRSNTRALEKKT